mgnify:CR=1 FL=1
MAQTVSYRYARHPTTHAGRESKAIQDEKRGRGRRTRTKSISPSPTPHSRFSSAGAVQLNTRVPCSHFTCHYSRPRPCPRPSSSALPCPQLTTEIHAAKYRIPSHKPTTETHSQLNPATHAGHKPSAIQDEKRGRGRRTRTKSISPSPTPHSRFSSAGAGAMRSLYLPLLSSSALVLVLGPSLPTHPHNSHPTPPFLLTILLTLKQPLIPLTIRP